MRAAVVVLALLIALRAATAEPCRVTAVLEGDGELVDATARALARRGVATTAAPACPAAKARLDRRGTAIVVTVIDPDGRSSERVLEDHHAAASLIESWARQDLNSGLLFGWTVDAPTPGIEAPAVIVNVPAPRARSRITLGAAGELGVDFDGATWTGGRAHACVRVGRACIGAIGRFASAAERRSYEVLGTIDVPFALGRRVALSAGAGIGTGWFQAPFTQEEAMRTFTANAIRIDGHATLAIALGRYLAIQAGISVGVSPSAPALIDAGGDAPRFLDEPGGFVRGELGIRIGAP